MTIKVKDDYLKDISKSTLPLTGGQIRVGGDYFYYDSFSYELNEFGEASYTFKLSEDLSKNPTTVKPSKVGQSAGVGEQVNYQGIPYYMEQMNEWVRDYAHHFNEIYGMSGATDSAGNDRTGEIFFTGDDAATGKQFDFSIPLNTTKYDSVSDAGYFMLTAGNFNVVKSVQNDPTTLVTHTVDSDGESKYDILDELKDLSTNKDKMSFRGCDAQSFLICLMGDSALNAQSANSFQEIYGNIEESIANSRFSISGVDSDEEAANMIKFQNAYNLASKMISVMNECYDRLITQTGV